ncbi:hypothetical protein EON77_00205, partial [bacterium]
MTLEPNDTGLGQDSVDHNVQASGNPTAAARTASGSVGDAQAGTASTRAVSLAAAEPFRELRKAIARLDADEDPGYDGLAIGDERFARKLAFYEEWTAKHGIAMPEKIDGTIHQYKIRQILRHVAIAPTPFSDAALAELSARRLAEAPTRHDPETEIDRAIDNYEELLGLRGFGPPRMASDPDKPARFEIAREMSRAVADLDRTAMRRLRGLVELHALTPGPLVGKLKLKSPIGTNAAVGPLLAAGLTTFGEGLPEDPLMPGRPDMITVAEVSGISVSDIVSGPGHRATIDAAAAAAALVPNPLLAARRYAWRDLIDWGRQRASEEHDAGRARKAVHALRGYLTMAGRTMLESDLVPLDLPERLAKAIVEDYRLFDAGWRRWMGDWVRWNDGLRASQPLPESLALKLRILMAERGVKVGGLVRELRRLKGQLELWIAGTSIPTAAAEPKLAAVADRLRVPLEVLKCDLREEWRKRYFESGPTGKAGKHLPFDFDERYDEEARLAKIEENAWRYEKQDTKYSRGLASRQRDEYQIKFKDWPEETKTAWERNWPKPPKTGGQRRLGDQTRRVRGADGKLEKAPKELREATYGMRRRQLEFVFGYWHLGRDAGHS